jgi:hypothetical protein
VRRIVVFVLVLVVVAGGITGGVLLNNQHQQKLAQQRAQQRLVQQSAAYTAGVDASNRADCERALSLFTAARSGGSAAVAAQANGERSACDELQKLRTTTATQKPAVALHSWFLYLQQSRTTSFQKAGQKAARAVLESTPLGSFMTAALCRQIDLYDGSGVVSMKRSDPLAPDYVAACAVAKSTKDLQKGLELFALLRDRFPKQAASKANVNALGRVLTSRLTDKGVRLGKPAVPGPGTYPLAGKTKLVVANGQSDDLEMILAGKATRLITVKACKTCSKVSTVNAALAQCARKTVSTRTVVLPAGRYIWSYVSDDDPDRPWVVKWDLKPNRVYSYCWWRSH